MLEPPTPAGEPFEAVEDNKSVSDFESVCISLVERGWKIMPKKGTYPINKKGPRYVNLVDPRGNRKSVRVIDENLWDKLRAAESRRTGKRTEDDLPKESLPENSTANDLVEAEIPKTAPMIDDPEPPEVSTQPVMAPIESLPVTSDTSAIVDTVPITNSNLPSEPTVTEVNSPAEISEVPRSESHAEIVENPPKEFQSFALSSPGLQKSIFDLGFETLLSALQNETLSPGEIVSKIQEWSLESRNLLEFVHKSQEKSRPPSALPESSEKDELISELQSTLKEAEDKLAETIQSLREM